MLARFALGASITAALSALLLAGCSEGPAASSNEVLAPSGAAAQSQLDVAIANVGQAEADVAARKADIARAKLNLEYTRIRAPIRGRIGRALVTEGARA